MPWTSERWFKHMTWVHFTTSPPSSTLQVTEQNLCLSLRGPCSTWKEMPISQFSPWFQPSSVQSDPAPIFSPSLAHSFLYLKGHFFLFIIKIWIEFDSDKHAMYTLMSYSVLTLEHGTSCFSIINTPINFSLNLVTRKLSFHWNLQDWSITAGTTSGKIS